MRHLRRGIPPGLFAVALLLAAPRAGADTLVSGTISTNTTWTVAGSPYILTGPVYVSGSPTPTLTIQAGVTVKGNSGTNLVISYPSGGVLQALGTASSPILFTANGSTTPGFWVGVYLGNLTATASQISYATVEYGGLTSYNRGGLHMEGSSPTIDHVTVRNSLVAGITVNGGTPSITASTLTGNSGPGLIAWAGSPSISGSTITNNSGYAMSAAAPASLLGLSGLTASGNGPGKDLIERQAGTITASQTWVLTTIPYVVTGSLYVEGSPMPVLTIQAGVTVKFNSLSQLVINYNTTGALQAVGTAASPILFTANGSTTPGFWYGLYFGQTAGGATASQIAYATVEYGGMTQYSRGGIHVWNCSPTFDHLTLRNNQVTGVSVNGGSPAVTNSTLTGNSGPGATVAAGNLTISGSTITTNSGNGIDLSGGSASVSSDVITSNSGYAMSAAAPASLLGLSGLTVSGNGPGKDMIERRAGTITASQTWVLTTIPYVVTGSLYVEGSPMPVLTIQAGVTVKFNSLSQLVVNYNTTGALQAVGTAASPILFTANGSTTPGFWYGLYFGQTAGGATASQIAYATVEYGGMTQYSRGGIHVWNCSPTFDHLTLRNNQVTGVSVNGGSPAVTNSTLTGNSGPGATVAAGNLTISGSTITTNSGNGIDLSGGSASVSSDVITSNTGYAMSAAAPASLLGLSGLTVSGNGPGKDMIERRAGTITASQTWVLTTIPYVVTGSLYVEGSPMPVLTIQAGVTVKFNSLSQLVVNYNTTGALQAVGTAASPILFTANGSTTPGFWYGLYFGQTAGGATASQIAYATVEYGGMTQYSRGGIHVWNCSPTFDHLTLRNNQVTGVSVNGGSPAVTNSTLTGNSGPGATVAAGNLTISGSTITTNSGNGIDLSGGSASVSSDVITSNTGYAMSAAANGSFSGLTGLTVSGNGPGKDMIERRAGTITASQTWVLTTIPYVVTGYLFVEGSPMPVLTIQAGVTVKFNSLSQLVVNYNTTGALQAVGTAASPILFTANGSTTPGFWYGLYFGQIAGGATASQIAYATVEYGGLIQYSRGGIHVWNCSPILDHLTLRNNLVTGISIDGGSTTITNTAFSGNPAGLTKTATPATVAARFNYWGAASGPSGGGPGTGQSVAAGVAFEPWLIASPSQPQFFNSFSQKNRTFNPTISVFTTITAGTTLSGNWTFSILNSGGTTIRTFNGSGTIGSVIWDGKNSSGVVQPNGTYSYQLASSAPGGTATIAQGITVIDTTKQVAISNLAVDQPFFSPNGDGVKDTVTVTGTNSFDDSTITVNVKNSGGTIVRTNTSIGGNFSYTWDGKNASSVVQPDGSYTFEVVATNGSASGTSTISTTLDNTPPVVTITAPTDGQILSNVYNNGATDVSVTGSATDLNFTNWSLDYGVGSNPSSFTALGSGTTAVSGATLGTWATLPLVDGIYTLRLQAWDKAGNRGIVQIRPNIENFSASLNANQLGTAAGGTVTVSSIVPFALTETVTIKNGTGQVVRTLVNAVARTAATYSDVWNGKNDSAAILPDGPYFYVASVTDGTHSLTWDLSNQFINDGYQYGVSTGPNYDFFNNRPLSLTYNFSRPGRVSVGFSPSGDPATGCPPPDYCLLLDRYEESGPHTVYFSGADATGKLVGTMVQTAAWSLRSNFAKNAIVVYGSTPTISNLTVTPAMYGPSVGSQAVAFDLTSYQNQAVTVTIAFVNQASVSALRTLTLSNQAPGHVVTTWDGKAVNGMWVAPGFYTVIVTATDSRGNIATRQILTTVLY